MAKTELIFRWLLIRQRSGVVAAKLESAKPGQGGAEAVIQTLPLKKEYCTHTQVLGFQVGNPQPAPRFSVWLFGSVQRVSVNWAAC